MGVSFKVAKPVWPKNRELEMNLTTIFRARFKNNNIHNYMLRITASSLYRFFVNGEFVGHGPARGPHGYYRVDIWDIPQDILKEDNIISIEVVGYNVNSYYLLDQPSFLQAEVICDDVVIVATLANGGFEARVLDERVQKVQKYSFQRAFTESYRISSDFENWKTDINYEFQACSLEEQKHKILIDRHVLYPKFEKKYPVRNYCKGTFIYDNSAPITWRDKSLTNISPYLKGYYQGDLEFILSDEMQKVRKISRIFEKISYIKNSMINLKANEYKFLDFEINTTGFIGMKVTAVEASRLILNFDEVLVNEDISFSRSGCVNGVTYELQKGTYNLETMEPYTLKYLELLVFNGDLIVEDIYIRELVNPIADKSKFNCSDEEINRIFEGARETFKQNAVDIYMDCPSRERAGWLCDSFFTARVEHDLTGKSIIEDNFIENFLLPKEFKFLPKGMLPMCYPAEQYDSVFIPNWALWFIVQLQEYLERTNNNETVQALKPRVMELLNYFSRFRNEYGLLENLECWVFIEWSRANDFVQNVNYPSNMLYAKVLEIVGQLYNEPQLIYEGLRIKDVIRKQAYNGEFFVDNAIRIDGRLEVTNNITEVCQYYAFFFGIATKESHKELLDLLVSKFGPKRDDKIIYPNVFRANSFVGNYLRIEILSHNGYSQEILDETKAFFTYMINKTGTLWENDGDYASCNHGFASHVAHFIYRDILGLVKIDKNNKHVVFKENKINISFCTGEIPIDDEVIRVEWSKVGGVLKYNIYPPKGYSYELIE